MNRWVEEWNFLFLAYLHFLFFLNPPLPLWNPTTMAAMSQLCLSPLSGTQHIRSHVPSNLKIVPFLS